MGLSADEWFAPVKACRSAISTHACDSEPEQESGSGDFRTSVTLILRQLLPSALDLRALTYIWRVCNLMAARDQSPAILFVVRCFHPPELVEFRNYAQVVL